MSKKNVVVSKKQLAATGEELEVAGTLVEGLENLQVARRPSASASPKSPQHPVI